MLTKSILTTAAIALIAGFGSASAGEQFETLGHQIEAAPLSELEMVMIRGQHIDIFNNGGLLRSLGGATIIDIEGSIGVGQCNGGCDIGGPLSTPGVN